MAIGRQRRSAVVRRISVAGQYELQKGSYSELSALYHKQILTALSDVENALIAVRETERGLRSETLATDSARRAYLAAAARLAEGTIDIVTLATVEIAYFQNQDLLVQARFAYLQALSRCTKRWARLVANDARGRNRARQ